MADKTISINFTGKDFSPINDAVENAKISVNGVNAEKEEIVPLGFSEGDIPLTNDNKRIILVRLLKMINNKDNPIYEPDFGNGEGYFGGMVGVVRRDITFRYNDFSNNDREENKGSTRTVNVMLQIQSRMDVTEENKLGKPYFLSTLLLEDKIQLRDDTVPNSEDEIFDYLLLFWFREQFREASRKGFYRTYRRFEKNDDRLKGSIDIARHIRLNMGQDNGKIAYSYRENTIDNFLNHMIVAAYECLKKKYYDLVTNNFDNYPDLKADMEFLKREIGYNKESSYELISRNLRPIAHPYYTEYEELRQTCLKILRNEGISIFDSDQDSETNGILFYLPDLWEKYLERKMRESLGPSMGGANQESVLLFTQEEYSVFGTRNSSKEEKYSLEQKTRPDYVFCSESKEHPFMILDAKFKPKWETAAFEETSISEVLGDYDKCIRDMNTIDAHATGVIFPVNKRDDNLKPVYIHPISKYNLRDCFYTIPVEIPYAPDDQSETYSSWRIKLDQLLEKPMGKVREFVDDEQKRYLKRKKLEEKIQNYPELYEDWKYCNIQWAKDKLTEKPENRNVIN